MKSPFSYTSKRLSAVVSLINLRFIELTESDAEMEKNEMAAEIRNLKDALAEKQVSDVVMIDTELDQLLKNVEKSQVYIGYPHIGPVRFIAVKIASFQIYSK